MGESRGASGGSPSRWFGRSPAYRLAHPRRGWKPEFKLERCPPLDGASCSALVVLYPEPGMPNMITVVMIHARMKPRASTAINFADGNK